MNISFGRPFALFSLLLLLPVIYYWYKCRAWKKRLREYLILFFRILMIVMLIFVISDFRYGKKIKKQAIIFIVDISDSIDKVSLTIAKDILKKSVNYIDEKNLAGLIVFGKDAMLETQLSSEPVFNLTRFSARPEGYQTNIESALILAQSMFPKSCFKKIVLMTDGNQTQGRFKRQLLKLKNKNIMVDVIPLGKSTSENEVLIDDLWMPKKVKQSEKFRLKVSVTNLSKQTKTGRLSIFFNNKYYGNQLINIKSGRNIYNLTQQIKDAGVYLYKLVLDVKDDKITDNNNINGIVEVVGKSKLLFVYNGFQDFSPFVKLLKEITGNNIDIIKPYQFPRQFHVLQKYDAVILSDISAVDLSPKKLKLIENYVKNMGGGLLVTGGENSFGLGGYYKTPVEKALPVNMDVKKAKFQPGTAIALLIDKSGSMGGIDNIESKIEIAKTSAILTAQILAAQDKICVIAFDGAAKWIVEPTIIKGNLKGIVEEIATLRAGGGTNMYPAMKLAYENLKDEKVGLKHIIVLSDGQTSSANFPELLDKIKNHKITVSAVGVGSGADKEFLDMLATSTNGRFYWTESSAKIPQIFMREAFQVSKNLIVEEEFKPIINSVDNIINNIDFSNVPVLKGYVRTSIKKNILVRELLKTPNKDTLLAYWNYGLGKSAVFTSDIFNKWGINWINWKGYNKLFKQLIKYLIRQPNSRNIKIETSENSQGILNIKSTILNNGNEFFDNLNVKTNIILPDGNSLTKKCRQTGPGEYSTSLECLKTGAYYIMVSAELNPNHKIYESMSIVKSYSEEFSHLGQNKKNLYKILETTGGVLNISLPELFKMPKFSKYYYTSYWKPLVLLSIIFLLLEIVCRRVFISYSSIKKKTIHLISKILKRNKTYQKEIDSIKVSSGLKEKLSEMKRSAKKVGYDINKEILKKPEVNDKISMSRTKITNSEKNSVEEQQNVNNGSYVSELLNIKKKKK